MKKFLQYIFLLIFFIFVVWLGIFALFLSSDTLKFAFHWQENQKGKYLYVAFDRPGNFSRIIPTGQLIDQTAIKKSLYYNGQSFEEFSHLNPIVIVKDGNIFVEIKNMKEGDEVILRSDIYNATKHTSYNIPAHVRLLVSAPPTLKITPQWLPKESKFLVNTDDFADFSPKDVRWYAYYPKHGESCHANNFLWNYHHYREVSIFSQEKKENGDLVSLVYHPEAENQCLIAGIGGKIVSVVNKKLPNFSLDYHGEVVPTNDDLLHKIIISSSSPLFGEKIQPKDRQKFAEKILFSPSVEISPENITLHSDRVEILVALQNEKTYRLRLSDVEDIYGRFTDFKAEIEVKIPSFLHMRLNNSLFEDFQKAKISITSHAPKNRVYSLKMCRTNFTGRENIEHFSRKKALDAIYAVLASSHISACDHARFSLDDHINRREIALTEIFGKINPDPGMYVIFLENKNDAVMEKSVVFPLLFSLQNTFVRGVFDKNGNYHISAMEKNTFLPKKHQEIRFVGVLKNSENFLPNTLSGVTLGTTNADGSLSGTLPKNFLQDFSGSGIIVASGEKSFGFSSIFLDYNGKFSPNPLPPFWISYAKNSLFVRAFLPENFSKNWPASLGIYTLSGKKLAEEFFRGNAFGVIEHTFSLSDISGDFDVILSLKNTDGGIFQQKQRVSISPEKTDNSEVFIDLRGINFASKSIPNGLKKIAYHEENEPWYSHAYATKIQVEATIRGNYASQANIRGADFSYDWYEIAHDGKGRKKISHGKKRIGSDGMGYAILDADFVTPHYAREYVLSVEVYDPIQKHYISAEKSFFVDIPEEMKTFDSSEETNLVIKNPLLQKGKNLVATLFLDGTLPSNARSEKYRYEISPMNGTGVLDSGNFTHHTIPFPTQKLEVGSYYLTVKPDIDDDVSLPKKTIYKTHFYVVNWRHKKIEKADAFVEKNHKNIDIQFISPYTNGSIFVYDTLTKKSRILSYSGSSVEIPVTVSRVTNNDWVWISSLPTPGQKPFEIIKSMDFVSPKKSVSMRISEISPLLDNKKDHPVVVSLDFLGGEKKSAQVFVSIFSQYQWISDVSQNSPPNAIIFDENTSKMATVPKNPYDFSLKNRVTENLVFTESSTTDENGVAKVTIPKGIPEGSYFLKIESVTKDGERTAYEQKISVRAEYILEAKLPEKVYPGDRFVASLRVKNATKTISEIDYRLNFTNNNSNITTTGSLIAQITGNNEILLPLKIPTSWEGEVLYRAEISKNSEILDTFEGKIRSLTLPNFSDRNVIFGSFTGSVEKSFIVSSLHDSLASRLWLRFSDSPIVALPTIAGSAKKDPQFSHIDAIYALIIRKISTHFGVKDENIDVDVKKISQNFSSKNLTPDEVIAFLEAKKVGLVFPEKIFSSMENIIKTSFDPSNFSQKNTDNLPKYLLIAGLFGNKTAEKFLSAVDFSKLSRADKIFYAHALLSYGRLPSENLISMIKKDFSEKNASKLFPENPWEKYYFARILYAIEKNDEAEKILMDALSQNSYEYATLLEKMHLSFLIKSSHARKRHTPTRAEFSALGIIGSGAIAPQKPIHLWEIDPTSVHSALKIRSLDATPVYFEWLENFIFEAPQLQKSKNSEHLTISHIIEEIDESVGVNEGGDWILVRPISWTQPLSVGKLYRVRYEIVLRNANEKFWEKLLFAFPKNAIISSPPPHFFDKNSQLWERWDWKNSYNGVDFFEKTAGKWNQKWIYDAYFIPKNSGTYLIPAAFAYFSDNKSERAQTTHEYVTIR